VPRWQRSTACTVAMVCITSRRQACDDCRLGLPCHVPQQFIFSAACCYARMCVCWQWYAGRLASDNSVCRNCSRIGSPTLPSTADICVFKESSCCCGLRQVDGWPLQRCHLLCVNYLSWYAYDAQRLQCAADGVHIISHNNCANLRLVLRVVQEGPSG
jgi:hypothetical protein